MKNFFSQLMNPRRNSIAASFGTNPLEGSSYYNGRTRMNDISRLHKALSEQGGTTGQVDDITWSDLEMDEVFLRINHTGSFIGEQVLYHRLHRLSTIEDQVPETSEGAAEGSANGSSERAVFDNRLNFLSEQPDLRLSMEAAIHSIGKAEGGYYLSEFLMESTFWKVGSTLLYHVLQLLLVITFAASVLLDSLPALMAFLAVALVNLGSYLFIKQRYEVNFTSLMEFCRVYAAAAWLAKHDSEGLFLTDEVRTSMKNLRKMSFMISAMCGRRSAAMSGDPVALLREYLYGILLIDVSLFNHLMNIISGKQKDVLRILTFVGSVDADISILSYRASIPQWCNPQIIGDGAIGDGAFCHGCAISAVSLAHPLLAHPVTNDFPLDRKAIVTGANASGKSTFMKALAINCILAQSIHTCTAREFMLPPLLVCTCMALRDDVLTGESYYFREAKYLKRMLDLTAATNQVLIVIDEILKGTNTRERIAASRAILNHIGRTGCYALVATHDRELTDTVFYKNYHFSSRLEENDVIFDYKIHEGIGTDSNAIALLAVLGYPADIVEKAKENLK